MQPALAPPLSVKRELARMARIACLVFLAVILLMALIGGLLRAAISLTGTKDPAITATPTP